MASAFNPIEIRELVLNIRMPIVLKNLKIPWKCFNMSLKEWCVTFENQKSLNESSINFEVARRKHFDCPQWEKYRNEKDISIREFLEEKSTFLEENWACLSYRNILELPKELREDVKFSSLGFSEIDDDETLFWLNTRDCNTPCHYDTYGCNMIVQVFGRKSWLLFPPNCSLESIRIPYEESSVYCATNFYSPKDSLKFNEIKDKCYRCVLEAGDLLIVPKNWWHYVESLETSLSFNHWIPLESDFECQLDECIVKYLIERLLAAEDESIIENFLNPNQLTSLGEESEILHILEKLCDKNLQKKMEHENVDPVLKKAKTMQYPYMYLSEAEIENLIKNLQFEIQYVKNISETEFLELMRNNSLRFDKNLEEHQDMNAEKKLKEVLINSICNPSVISNIRKLLLKSYNKIND